MGTVITGIATLDLTEAAQETLEEIVSISGVASLLLSTRAAKVLGPARIEGCASIAVIPDGTVFLRETTYMDAAYLSSLPTPTTYSIDAGAVLVLQEDVGAALLQQSVLRILGEEGIVVCPPALRGVVEALRRTNANIVVGPNAVTRGDFTLDPIGVAQIPADARMLHIGALTALEPIEVRVLEERVASLEVRGTLVTRAAVHAALRDRLVTGARCRLEVVPDNARYIRGELTIDDNFVSGFRGSLWVTDGVTVAAEVDEEALIDAVPSLHAREVLCPARLAGTVERLTGGTVVPQLYRDDLITFEARYDLAASELGERADTVAVIGDGLLSIDAGIPRETLASHLEYIAVSGVVECSERQVGVVKSKLRGREATIVDRDARARAPKPSAPSAPPQHRVITGAAHVKL